MGGNRWHLPRQLLLLRADWRVAEIQDERKCECKPRKVSHHERHPASFLYRSFCTCAGHSFLSHCVFERIRSHWVPKICTRRNVHRAKFEFDGCIVLQSSEVWHQLAPWIDYLHGSSVRSAPWCGWRGTSSCTQAGHGRWCIFIVRRMPRPTMTGQEPSPPSWLTSAWQHQDGSARRGHGLHSIRRHLQFCY